MVESGRFYKTFIDPLVAGIRKKLVLKINKGERVIDIACGTGSQVFAISEKASEVVGVDLSESMIKTANKHKLNTKCENARFYIADASNLEMFNDDEFDVSTMTLALHQFPPEFYPSVLNEMKRISTRLIIIDYSVPASSGIKKLFVHIIEFLAGKEHFQNFRKFNKKGGLIKIIEENNLLVTENKKIGSGIFNLVECKK